MAYTTWGPNRQCCCHMHRTIKSAEGCIEKDVILSRKNGGPVSDREIRVVESIEELREYDPKSGPGHLMEGT